MTKQQMEMADRIAATMPELVEAFREALKEGDPVVLAAMRKVLNDTDPETGMTFKDLLDLLSKKAN